MSDVTCFLFVLVASQSHYLGVHLFKRRRVCIFVFFDEEAYACNLLDYLCWRRRRTKQLLVLHCLFFLLFLDISILLWRSTFLWIIARHSRETLWAPLMFSSVPLSSGTREVMYALEHNTSMYTWRGVSVIPAYYCFHLVFRVSKFHAWLWDVTDVKEKKTRPASYLTFGSLVNVSEVRKCWVRWRSRFLNCQFFPEHSKPQT